MTNEIRFFLNGELRGATARPDTTVLEWLRNDARLTGTKEGCAEGDCGACTILVQRASDAPPLAANACIMALGQIDGAAITTVEGLGRDGAPHPVQRAMAENGSSQCGFCTPGIAVALAGLLARNPSPDEPAIHDALAGNLCRCTGYRPIVEAVKAVAAAGGASVPQHFSDWPTANPAIATGGATFHQPETLADLLRLRAAHPDAVLLAGGTDLGVPLAEFASQWDVTISTARVAELSAISETADTFRFGAAATWEQILAAVEPVWPSLATLIRRFGSTQIRSMGTIGGNIGTASPIGDGPPALIALGASIVLASQAGERSLPLQDYFLDYRKTALKKGEVIARID
nr:FAD binding domain-containing protein [Rhizobiaceae bacterium]